MQRYLSGFISGPNFLLQRILSVKWQFSDLIVAKSKVIEKKNVNFCVQLGAAGIK